MTYFCFSKVAFIHLFWQTENGTHQRPSKPKTLTVHGDAIHSDELAPYIPGYELETILERARRLDIVDKWIPWIRINFTANRTLQFSGDKAVSIWKAWSKRIFAKKKNKEN